MLRNGEAADPPAFLTEQPDWQPGDVFVAANGRAFRIVDTDAEIEVAGMVLFDAIWTVEPLEESLKLAGVAMAKRLAKAKRDRRQRDAAYANPGD
jgi:hypothetical protein